MVVVHFVVGRPKQNTANGVLSAVDTLFSAQHESDTISPTVVGFLKHGREVEVDTSTNTRFFPVAKFPFILPSAVISFIKSLDPENTVCHMHMVHIPLFFMLSFFLKRKKIKYVISPHGGFAPNSLTNSRWKKLVFRVLFQNYINRGASKFIALSAGEKADIESYGIESGDIAIIPNGLRIQTFIPPSGRPCSEFNVSICYLGRLDYWNKGLNILAAAFAKLPSKYHDKQLILELIGPDWDGGLSKLRQDFLSTKTIGRVNFHGPLFGERKHEVMIGSDVFVLPSRNEGMPVSVLEAMGLGLPVVVSRETNIPVDAYEAGACLFVNLDADSLAQSLDVLLSDKTRRERMAISAQKYAVTSFSLSKIIDDYKGVYSAL